MINYRSITDQCTHTDLFSHSDVTWSLQCLPDTHHLHDNLYICTHSLHLHNCNDVPSYRQRDVTVQSPTKQHPSRVLVEKGSKEYAFMVIVLVMIRHLL